MSSNIFYYGSILICVGLFITLLTTTRLPSESDQAMKLIAVVAGFSFLCSLILAFLAFLYFSSEPVYLMQFLLAITVLVLLPVSLTSMSITTSQLSSLRDVVAAKAQV
jgi:hypothetical protein